MTKDVIISISGQQLSTENDPDVIEFITNGSYSKKNGNYSITYKESELTGLDGSVTTLTVTKDGVSMVRTGPFPTQLIFEKHRKHLSLYETGEGPIVVAVNTNSIESTLSDSGGDLSIAYSLEVEHAAAGANTLKINVREAPPFLS